MTRAFVSAACAEPFEALKAMGDHGYTVGCAAADFTMAYLQSDRAGPVRRPPMRKM
jgi:hypothetical protein